jgi:NLI interacting factor-like phosphatase
MTSTVPLSIQSTPLSERTDSKTSSADQESPPTTKMSQLSVKGVVKSEVRSHLVILDVNGLLCCKLNHTSDEYKEFKEDTNLSILKTRTYTMVGRSGVQQFIEHLMEQYEVGIFSSTTYHNIRNILPALLGDELTNRLSFIASRAATKLDPEYGIDEKIAAHDTVKYLIDIWGHPFFNQKRIWDRTNTLIVDNDQRKVRFNDQRNVLVVDEWNLTQDPCFDDLLKELKIVIQKL